MFACAMYPGDSAFLSSVAAEVTDQVNRLKNHPSLALWCGNNEVDEGWKNWGWQKQYAYTKSDSSEIAQSYTKLFHEIIPQIIQKEDSGRYYHPSSPAIGWGRAESLTQQDAHYWGVWWGMEPFEIYEKKVGRFMSEYGFQGMPSVQTFKKFMPNYPAIFDSASFKNHQKHPTGYQTIAAYMERDYVVPQKFNDYVYVSQLLQARGMKTAMEAHLRASNTCMGTLFWQLNDCWPVTSWSSIDFYGNRKALFYQSKRSFAPILISFEYKEKKQVQVFLVQMVIVLFGMKLCG
jgi:beta-mannosidase